MYEKFKLFAWYIFTHLRHDACLFEFTSNQKGSSIIRSYIRCSRECNTVPTYIVSPSQPGNCCLCLANWSRKTDLVIMTNRKSSECLTNSLTCLTSTFAIWQWHSLSTYMKFGNTNFAIWLSFMESTLMASVVSRSSLPTTLEGLGHCFALLELKSKPYFIHV